MSNTITFVGNLTKNATVGNTTGGGTVLRCNVANNIGFGDRQTTQYFNVSLFGKRAEGRLVDFLQKGQPVFVSGELSAREYQQDGQTRTSLDIVANTIDLVGRRGNSKSRGNDNPPPEAYENDYG